jgi:ankyrin repeat protein
MAKQENSTRKRKIIDAEEFIPLSSEKEKEEGELNPFELSEKIIPTSTTTDGSIGSFERLPSILPAPDARKMAKLILNKKPDFMQKIMPLLQHNLAVPPQLDINTKIVKYLGNNPRAQHEVVEELLKHSTSNVNNWKPILPGSGTIKTISKPLTGYQSGAKPTTTVYSQQEKPSYKTYANNHINEVCKIIKERHIGKLESYIKAYKPEITNKLSFQIISEVIKNHFDTVYIQFIAHYLELNLLSLKDEDGNNLLHIAASAGNKNAVEYLFTTQHRPQDAILKNYDYISPIEMSKNQEIEQIFLTNGAIPVGYKLPEETTNNDIKTKNEIIQNYITIEAPKDREFSELVHNICNTLAKKYQQHTLKYFLTKVSDNKEAFYIIDFCIKESILEGFKTVMQIFSASKELSIISCIDYKGNNILQKAIIAKHNKNNHDAGDIIGHLLARYYKELTMLNYQNKEGDTALHIAAKLNESGVVKALFEHCKADINIKNNLGKTPLEVAANQEIIDILSQQNTYLDNNIEPVTSNHTLCSPEVGFYPPVIKLSGYANIDATD